MARVLRGAAGRNLPVFSLVGLDGPHSWWQYFSRAFPHVAIDYLLTGTKDLSILDLAYNPIHLPHARYHASVLESP